MITDPALPVDVLLARVEAALSVGPEVAVQLRLLGAPVRALLDLGRALQPRCIRHGNTLFINRRLDVALALGASLHLPADGLLAADARPHLAPDALLSVAVHDPAEAAEAFGADLALVSPVFAPGSKPEDRRPTLGPEGFARLAATLPCPAFALGGVTAETARALPGAAGFAVISAVLHTDDPARAASALLALR